MRGRCKFSRSLMSSDTRAEIPIVQPPARRRRPRLPPRVVMAATRPDFQRLRKRLSKGRDPGERLYLSRIHRLAAPQWCLVGPFMGAPQTAMLMETVAAWGGAQFLFFGWCGAIHSRVHTGDILLPTTAFAEEGTSRAYGVTDDRIELPATTLHDKLRGVVAGQGLTFHEGAVWSTDAVFQETPSKVRAYRRRGALAVEMEISICFTVARQRGLDFAAALVVSDELADMRWRPGFSDSRFKEAREAVSRTIELLCQTP